MGMPPVLPHLELRLSLIPLKQSSGFAGVIGFMALLVVCRLGIGACF